MRGTPQREADPLRAEISPNAFMEGYEEYLSEFVVLVVFVFV